MKHLGVNLTKHVQDLHAKNYTTLMKETEDLKKICCNVYLFLTHRETEHEQGRVREREGDTESEAGSRL